LPFSPANLKPEEHKKGEVSDGKKIEKLHVLFDKERRGVNL
jgi:hypothetical protein